ncbi:TRAP transporter TatT component family protein [Trichloromonas sp.]|uniref:TRAP transporter TatT component family protein n=1 Tax=Trichloromonas sp. TaxID=3069249 RepID=UPI002A37FECE|nr:TRAP transporter TatT component family protein [Trichloromonas sp.]
MTCRCLALASALVAILLLLGGCIGRMSNDLSRAVLDHPDPQTVRQGIPAYLLLLDSLLLDDPTDKKLLSSAASLYALNSSLTGADPVQRRRQAERAWVYGRRLVEVRDAEPLWERAADDFASALTRFGKRDVPRLYAFGVAWLARLQAGEGDPVALADLPKVEALFARLVELDEGYQQGAPQLYLGILRLLRPPALGGAPEQGRAHLERAMELSGGRYLAAKVELARRYARMFYDRELHDRLLLEVLAADPVAEGLTLFNVLAQEEARALLASADDYF